MPIFQNPAVLMTMYDPSFRTGKYRLIPKQLEIMAEYSRNPKPPVKISVVGSNGCGKSSVLVAAMASWSAIEFPMARVAVTSSSGAQLDIQSFHAIKELANNMNRYHNSQLWDIKYRDLEFRPTHSFIHGRQTDEEGRMEGMHPLVPGGEFAIFVDEGKSIPEEIFAAIIKWTGFTRRVDISSAGEPAGTFYQNHTSGRWWTRKIIADDCPWIDEDTKREVIANFGENHPKTREILYCEFTSTVGSLVMTYETVTRAIRMAKDGLIPYKKSPANRAGVDLSGGGDEFCMSVWNGNKQLALETLQTTNAVDQADEIQRLTEKWQLPYEGRFADAGGLGKAILDILDKRECRWQRVFNQSRPLTMAARNYGNRGTEMWVHFGKLMHDGALIIMDDPRQKSQLANRYYTQQLSSDKIIIEPKKQAIAKGHPSPDRADATVLANCKYRIDDEANQEVADAKKNKLSPDKLLELYEDLMDGKTDMEEINQNTGALTMESITGHKIPHI